MTVHDGYMYKADTHMAYRTYVTPSRNFFYQTDTQKPLSGPLLPKVKTPLNREKWSCPLGDPWGLWYLQYDKQTLPLPPKVNTTSNLFRTRFRTFPTLMQERGLWYNPISRPLPPPKNDHPSKLFWARFRTFPTKKNIFSKWKFFRITLWITIFRKTHMTPFL